MAIDRERLRIVARIYRRWALGWDDGETKKDPHQDHRRVRSLPLPKDSPSLEQVLGSIFLPRGRLDKSTSVQTSAE